MKIRVRDRVKLGDEVRDKISGFEGVIVARTEYLWGCVQYAVASRRLKDSGEVLDWLWLDVDRVEIVQREEATRVVRLTGGPQPAPPKERIR